MNQKLIWNFECSTTKESTPNLSDSRGKDDLKWEVRFFWPEDQVITIHLFDNSLLDISLYEHKHREDEYYIFPNEPINIKRRRNKLLYKPIVKHSGNAIGFGSKINLEALPEKLSNKSHLNDILRQIKSHPHIIHVKKEAYIYKLPTSPGIKLELARLQVSDQVYTSICIEGRSLKLVETISEYLLGQYVSCDYVTFLKKIMKS